MRISVKDKNGRRVRIALPDLLILNGCAAGLVRKHTKGVVNISGINTAALRRAVRKYKKTHKDFTLLEAVSGDCAEVVIKL